MKKICCLFFTVILCLSVLGCQSDSSDGDLKGYETVIPDEFDGYLSGPIIEKISPDILVVKPDNKRKIENYGEVVHIVTDEADEWCVGDEIEVIFSVAHVPREGNTEKPTIINADKVVPLVRQYKPIIYLYPEQPTKCSVELTLDGHFTCTYPEYGEEGWRDFTAYPDGTLVFPDGKEYYALYWEGTNNGKYDFSKGFCVRGEDTAEFLELALKEQGLTSREANEFIVYWLPLMQDNLYNVIAFQSTAYTDGAVLDITPMPDNVLRVFMSFYPSETFVDIQPQEFECFARKGFTVVEWGGSEVQKP